MSFSYVLLPKPKTPKSHSSLEIITVIQKKKTINGKEDNPSVLKNLCLEV